MTYSNSSMVRCRLFMHHTLYTTTK